tara:strand:- start:2712 stop:2963 length:252 start_codon:yes stop_codon:yes gene_type:complete
VAFFEKIGRMLQEDFSPPFDGFFFLKLLLYLAFFTFCFRVFGSSGCMNTQPEGRIIQGPQMQQNAIKGPGPAGSTEVFGASQA